MIQQNVVFTIALSMCVLNGVEFIQHIGRVFQNTICKVCNCNENVQNLGRFNDFVNLKT